jgi:hypothetical protein
MIADMIVEFSFHWFYSLSLSGEARIRPGKRILKPIAGSACAARERPSETVLRLRPGPREATRGSLPSR